MNVENQIVIDKFQPRDYQLPILDALENEGYRRIFYISPRRSGKDLLCWNYAIRTSMRKPGLVYHCLPSYSDGRKAIWNAIDIQGNSFLSYLPKQAVESLNQTEMSVRFRNGSILQVVGAESFDKVFRGTNPRLVIFSEFGHMENALKAYETLIPILSANKGTFIAITTPNGQNDAYHLYNMVKDLPDWYTLVQTTSEIQHIEPEELEAIKATMSPEMYMQEFECSFTRGIDGSYYGRLLSGLKRNNQITSVPWEPYLLTHCAIDIGVHDATTIVWFQVIGDGVQIRIIDSYSVNGMGLDHIATVIKNKPYRMGKLFAPHDLAVREWGGGAVSRYELAKRMDLTFTILKQNDILDGIELVMSMFQKLWFDEVKCKSVIDALENYRKPWNEARKMYDSKPMKNWACHYADAIRYMCQAIPFTKQHSDGSEYERLRNENLRGGSNFPKLFPNERPENYR